jgi:hypothetical protein
MNSPDLADVVLAFKHLCHFGADGAALPFIGGFEASLAACFTDLDHWRSCVFPPLSP